MPRVHAYIRRHRPLIMSRIQFYPTPLPELPLIVSRIEFQREDLRKHSPELSEADAAEDIPVIQSQRRDSSDTSGRAGKIPKPPGEPGRPRSGGFTLEAALKEHGWTDNDTAKFILEVRDAAQDKLDTSSCFRNQDAALIQEICDQMSSGGHWQVLDNYQNCWPVRSALKLALKYTAEASRRSETKKTTARFRNVINGMTE